MQFELSGNLFDFNCQHDPDACQAQQGGGDTGCENDEEFARGLTNYSAEEAKVIKGKRTDQIEPLLGYMYYDEVIHRDNLVILDNLEGV